MRAGAVNPGKPVRSANGIAGGGAVRGALASSACGSVEVAKTAQGTEIIKTIQRGGCKAEVLKTTFTGGTEVVKTQHSGSVQTDRQKHIDKAKALKTMSVRYTEVVKTKHSSEQSRGRQAGGQKSIGGAEALKTAQDKGSEITITTPAGGTEVVETEHSMQTGGGSKIVNAQARPLPVKGARISAKNKTAPQNGAEQRGLEDAPAPAFPRRRLTSSEVKQLVDRAMEKLKEERPTDYALLYELYFNRVSLRSLSRTLRIPRSTLRYRKRLALSRIKKVIEKMKK